MQLVINMKDYIIFSIIIIMTYLGAQASVFLKKASDKKSLKASITSSSLYCGGGLYLICSLMNIWVLKYLEYSKMLPLTSITYIWTLILAYLVFKEKISKRKIIGILAISIGSFLVAW